MARFPLFYRLMVRPLFAEPVRTSLTVLAIALGVAVVLAIDLALVESGDLVLDLVDDQIQRGDGIDRRRVRLVRGQEPVERRVG